MKAEADVLGPLLKNSLWRENLSLSLLTPIDWDKLITLSAKQGVCAFAYEGFTKLCDKQSISKESFLRWALSVSRLEAGNKRKRAVLKELISIFEEEGIKVLLLKGIGLASYYDQPLHRECGDIDIYLFGDYEKGNEIIQKLGIEVEDHGPKHSFFFFKGVPVENHKFFLNVQDGAINSLLENYLHQVLSEQGCDTLMIDDFKVNIPTPDFTAIFLTHHNITHFLSSGFVLRHFCDLAVFFTRNESKIDFVRLEQVLKDVGEYDLLAAFMDIAVKYLGMPCERFSFILQESVRISLLSDKIMAETFNNKERALDRNVLENMWIPRRKLRSVRMFFLCKWKYDAIGRWNFYSTFIKKVTNYLP